MDRTHGRRDRSPWAIRPSGRLPRRGARSSPGAIRPASWWRLWTVASTTGDRSGTRSWPGAWPPAPITTPSWSFEPMNAGARTSRASSSGISRWRSGAGAHLSGGIDSSSVAVLAQRLSESGAASARIEAFTQSHPELADDERPFAEETASRWGIKWHALLPDPPGPGHYEEQARRYLDFPDYPNGTAWSLALTRLAASNGCRVMLTGVWGNAFLEGSIEHLADLLRSFRLAE